MEQHEDFTRDIPNSVWTWVDSNAGYAFEEVVINNAIAGDTDSIMLTFPNGILDGEDQSDIIAISDAIAEMTNDTFPEFVKFAFNAPDSRKDVIQTDREIISDASFFLSKKRYILHVVNDEGKQSDKLKIMGVELKKSDTPEAVKTMLKELVDIILSGGNKQDAKDAVKRMKNEYPSYDIREIARPMSVNGLKVYNDAYAMDGSMKGFPYNVRAAMFYNSMCGPSDKKIVPGDKIGIVYIKDSRSKYIGFPIDINTLPSFVEELKIDYETQWDKAHKKLISYMSSMGWDIQSQKKAKRNEIFGF